MRALSDETGTATILFSLALTVLTLLFLAVAVDISRAVSLRAVLGKAADAGARAAAKEIRLDVAERSGRVAIDLPRARVEATEYVDLNAADATSLGGRVTRIEVWARGEDVFVRVTATADLSPLVGDRTLSTTRSARIKAFR